MLTLRELFSDFCLKVSFQMETCEGTYLIQVLLYKQDDNDN